MPTAEKSWISPDRAPPKANPPHLKRVLRDRAKYRHNASSGVPVRHENKNTRYSSCSFTSSEARRNNGRCAVGPWAACRSGRAGGVPCECSLEDSRNLESQAPAAARSRRASRARKQFARDHHALHFAGAFVNRQHARVAVIPFHVAFAGIAGAAMNLHRLGHHAVHHFAGI